MALRELRIENLRCIRDAAVEFRPGINLISGPNGSGKTSLLEAVFLLGRGRSFRAPRAGSMIQTGRESAIVYGEAESGSQVSRLGIRLDRQKTEVHIDGRAGRPIAELAARLPVQLIDPQVHDLIQGGPGERRRFLDWGVFHVKHDFLRHWRRYRRVQQQRNAALRQGASIPSISAWDNEFIESAEAVNQARREYMEEFTPIFVEFADKIGITSVKLSIQSGYPEGDLAQALIDGLDRDIAMGTTLAGPHRMEMRIDVDNQPARHRLSRGQQKLLGASLVLAQAAHVREARGRDSVLLVDEPAAELDAVSLERLLITIAEVPAQILITALRDDALPLPKTGRQFHVEQGKIRVLL